MTDTATRLTTTAADDCEPCAAAQQAKATRRERMRTGTAGTTFATVDLAEADEATEAALADAGAEETVRWAGPIGIEGELTGDGRFIQPEALRWDSLPMPLRYVDADMGAHQGAVVVGRIDTCERISTAEANVRLAAMGREPIPEVAGVGVVWGAGDFDLGSEEGKKAARSVGKGYMRGVSMDLDDVAFEVRIAAEAAAMVSAQGEQVQLAAPDADGRVTVKDVAPDDEVMVTLGARVRAATIVAVPAFANAQISLTGDTLGYGDTKPAPMTGGALVASLHPLSAVGSLELGMELLQDALDSGVAVEVGIRDDGAVLYDLRPEADKGLKIRLTLNGDTYDVDYPAFPFAHEEFNWVEKVGGLPKYIRRIADHLKEKGKAEGHAIAIAVNVVKKMCSTGDLNFPGKQSANKASRAEACAAVAEWEAKKKAAKAAASDGDAMETLVASFNPDQWRNPKDGQWIDMPGIALGKVVDILEQVQVPEGQDVRDKLMNDAHDAINGFNEPGPKGPDTGPIKDSLDEIDSAYGKDMQVGNAVDAARRAVAAYDTSYVAPESTDIGANDPPSDPNGTGNPVSDLGDGIFAQSGKDGGNEIYDAKGNMLGESGMDLWGNGSNGDRYWFQPSKGDQITAASAEELQAKIKDHQGVVQHRDSSEADAPATDAGPAHDPSMDGPTPGGPEMTDTPADTGTASPTPDTLPQGVTALTGQDLQDATGMGDDEFHAEYGDDAMVVRIDPKLLGVPEGEQYHEDRDVAVYADGKWFYGGSPGITYDSLQEYIDNTKYTPEEGGTGYAVRKTLMAAAPPIDPDAPPAKFFSNPNLTGPTPLTITDEGHVYGHIATWDTCHLTFTQMGKCVKPPRSKTGYAYFRTGAVRTAEGSEIAVGQITLGTGHAGESLSAAAALSHYDNTGMAAADVAVGDDRWGIWVAGALRPGLSAADVRAFRASPVSGDWRRYGAGLELVAALAVNVQGFPVPRPHGLVASGAMTTLVAAGMLAPAKVSKAAVESGELSTDDLRYLKRLAAREKAEAELAKADLLDRAAALSRQLRASQMAQRVASFQVTPAPGVAASQDEGTE